MQNISFFVVTTIQSILTASRLSRQLIPVYRYVSIDENIVTTMTPELTGQVIIFDITVNREQMDQVPQNR